jgi:hypothetical protein
LDGYLNRSKPGRATPPKSPTFSHNIMDYRDDCLIGRPTLLSLCSSRFATPVSKGRTGGCSW